MVWFQKASDQGHHEAQYEWAMHLLSSQTPAQTEKAIDLLRNSALCCAKAMNALGVFNLEGKYVERNPRSAFLWFKDAAGLGHLESQMKLSLLYREGIGTDRDLQRASEWSKLASDQNSKNVLQSAGVRLSERVWRPIANQIGAVENVVISPDSTLWLLPWSALPLREPQTGENQYLVEKYNLRMVTSARDLLHQRDNRTADGPVVFADPFFDQSLNQKRGIIEQISGQAVEENQKSQSRVVDQKLLPNVSPLPSTSAEADAIEEAILSYTSREPVLYREGRALEHTVKDLKNPAVAVFATHGFFLSTQEVERRQFQFVSSDYRRSIVLDKSNKPLENPLLRCGLLLAGCNDVNSVVGDDDGVLTGLEITGIDFRGTELVVLSACDTGVGDVRNGEGVAGLRQAFQLAGAESVLASLWKVDDAEAARLMKQFFDNLSKGMSKSNALRQAQLARIKARRARHGQAHPFFWAAFTLTGKG